MAPTSPMVTRVAAFRATYLRVCEALGAASMFAVAVITIVQVFVRYFLNDSLVWAEEGCRALLIWTCFLFAGVAFQRGEMVAMESLTRMLSPRLRALLIVPGYFITCAFLLAMVYYGWIYARQNVSQTVPGLEMLLQSVTGLDWIFPIFWVYLAVPIGCAILFVHMFASALILIGGAFGSDASRKREA